MVIIAAIAGFFIGSLIIYLCGSRLIKLQWKMIDYFSEETKEIPNLMHKVDELECKVGELECEILDARLDRLDDEIK